MHSLFANRRALRSVGLLLAVCSVTAACQSGDSEPRATATPTALSSPFDPVDVEANPLIGTDEEVATCEAIDYSAPDQGQMTFNDEFEGTEINRSVWRVRDETNVDFDQAQILRENVTVADGMLTIKGRKLPESQWRTIDSSRYDWNKVRDYSTGYIDGIKEAGYGNEASDERFSQQYGYFEIRAKVPSAATLSRGIWPAFWLRADDEMGEIDVLEAYGAPTTRDFDPSSTYYWNSWADTTQQSTRDHVARRVRVPGDQLIWQDFHTYGVNWSPDCLRYTFDGQTVGIVPLDTLPYFTGDTWDAPFHFRLNLHIGSDYWGQADDANTRPEFDYLIDYVRAYQGNEFL